MALQGAMALRPGMMHCKSTSPSRELSLRPGEIPLCAGALALNRPPLPGSSAGKKRDVELKAVQDSWCVLEVVNEEPGMDREGERRLKVEEIRPDNWS